MKETKRRSIAKAISFRIIATLTTFILVWVFTGQILIAAGIGGIEFILKIIFYYGHERAWNHIKWGINNVEEAQESRSREIETRAATTDETHHDSHTVSP